MKPLVTRGFTRHTARNFGLEVGCLRGPRSTADASGTGPRSVRERYLISEPPKAMVRRNGMAVGSEVRKWLRAAHGQKPRSSPPYIRLRQPSRCPGIVRRSLLAYDHRPLESMIKAWADN